MNQYMTTQGQRNVPNGAIDVWSQGQGGTQLAVPSPQQPQQAPASPVAIVQRLLRGRVALAVVLGGIGALIGAAAGYMSQAPQFESNGLIGISPVIPIVEGDKTMPYYQQFMSSEALKMASPAVIDQVPNYEPWKSDVGKDPAALADLSGKLKTAYQKNTFNISLTYDAVDPKLARAGVMSTIAAYQAQYKKSSDTSLSRKINELLDRQRNLLSQKAAAEADINGIISKYGSSDLQALVTAAQQKVQDIDRERRGYANNYRAARDAIEVNRSTNNKIPLEDLAQVDPGIAKLIGDARAQQIQTDLMEKRLGSNHPQVRTAKIQLQVMNDSIEVAADTLRKQILGIIPDFVKGGYMEVTPTALKLLETRVNSEEQEQNDAEKERDEIAKNAGKVAGAQTVIKKLTDDLTKLGSQLETMQFQAAMNGDMSVLMDGSYAAKVADKKILFGLAGAMVGACVPVALLMLLGLMDTRFRYSDDAAGQGMAGIPLLGILPNLPDRLSDPAQASIAAHCVHQIRTMLQLNAMREGSTAFAVTSASSGDGKTSLSLALGLSFAASGSRTLLIDADLVGGGLTSRLGNNSAVGIVDALAGVGLEECVQPTDVADLSLLPIGGAQAHHAGSFSPPAVRKLLATIRKHYEVIIIDTGPVMGSIEATPIAASVDGVVLTVARGQSRPLVERAITHLTSIGAKVAGVVFNRAQHKDFEQSIGAISIRSAARSTANGTGHNGRGAADMGAVAKAVATSVRSEI